MIDQEQDQIWWLRPSAYLRLTHTKNRWCWNFLWENSDSDPTAYDCPQHVHRGIVQCNKSSFGGGWIWLIHKDSALWHKERRGEPLQLTCRSFLHVRSTKRIWTVNLSFQHLRVIYAQRGRRLFDNLPLSSQYVATTEDGIKRIWTESTGYSD